MINVKGTVVQEFGSTATQIFKAADASHRENILANETDGIPLIISFMRLLKESPFFWIGHTFQ